MHQPKAQHATQSESQPVPVTTISVIGSLFSWLAELAGTMKPAEFRVFLYLAAHAEPPEFTIRQSSRHIAEALQMARSAVVRAIDGLSEGAYITARQGTGTTAAGYIVNALKTIPISGPFGGPLAVEKKDLVLSEDHYSGPFGGPLAGRSGPFGGPLLNKDRAGARVDRTSPISDTIDRYHPHAEKTTTPTRNTTWDATITRVLRSTPADWTAEQLTDAEQWIHGHQTKMRGAANPPDQRILAHILAALTPATPELLCRLLDADHPRPRPGERYSWYVSVALERQHGIPPDVFAAARAHLRGAIAKPPGQEDHDVRATVNRAIATVAMRRMR